MSRATELAKNTLIISFGTFLPKFASIITLPIVTAGLTKSEFGTYDFINTLVSLFLPLVTLQIQAAAFRFLIDCRENENDIKKIVTNIYVFILPVSLAALLILYFALSLIDTLTKVLICSYFFFDLVMLATQQIVRGLSDNKLFSQSAVLQSVVNMVALFLSVSIFKKGLIGVLLSITIATIMSNILLILKGKIIKYIDFALVSKETLMKLLSYSWPMIPNALSNWVLSVSDRVVLTAFLGLEATAIYAAANKIPTLFMTVQSTFVYAWQENASISVKDADSEKYYSIMLDNVFSILCGIMAILIATTPILFKILIRGNYGEAYQQMPILFLGVFFSALSAFMGGIYVAHKRTKSVGITTIIAAICNLIIDLFLVRSIGVFAASLSTLASYALLFIYRMIDVSKFQKIKYNYPKMIFCLLALVIMCIFCWMCTIKTLIVNCILAVIIAPVVNLEVIKSIVALCIEKFRRKK